MRRHFIIKEWRQPFFGTNPGSYRPPFRIRTGVLFPDFLAWQMAVHASMTAACRAYRTKKHRLLLINKGRCSHRGTTLFQGILCPALIFCAIVCCTDIRLTAYGRHAFRRKAPILKVPEGSCGMLSAGGAPSLTHYIFCTHVCSQPESVLVLHSSGVLSSCRFSWFSFMNDTSLYDW